ncbi:MAG: rhodanese-related sulfurtransferase [Pseudomonadota bacterium]
MQQDSPARNIIVAAFYRFHSLEQPEALKTGLLAACETLGVRGTILLAPEGVNGTISGSREGIDAALAAVRALPGMAPLEAKESLHDAHPFGRMRVKLKREIVTMGVAGLAPGERTGEHVPPERWNALIRDPGVKLIDTRNRYEVHLGTFEGAIDPETESFRDFPDWVARELDPARDRRVAMFCTGGIRCEKATAYLLEQGFESVYQLEGGILNYLEQVPADASAWRGECFVFDDRVTVDHALEAGEVEVCPNCRIPILPGEKDLPEFEEHVSCVHCFDRTTERRRAGLAERRRQETLAQVRGESEA